MKNYELMTIFKPNLDAEEVEKVIEKINATIVEFGGNVVSTDKGGRKKLAYEIQNFRDGFFACQVGKGTTEHETRVGVDVVPNAYNLRPFCLQGFD